MSKIKKWDVSVLSTKRINKVKDSYFFTTDTDANLEFKLTDDLQPATATITMVNKDDESVVSEQVEVIDNKLTFPLVNEKRNIIQHAGKWMIQVIYENNSDYTTQWIDFSVRGSVIGNKKPSLEIIDSYRILEAQLLDLMRNYKGQIESLHERIDNISLTPAEGISEQEIIDARVSEDSLGAKIRNMDDERKRNRNESSRKYAQLDKELTTHKQTINSININQEARQTADGRRVVSLPKTSGEGHGQFGLMGLTATNLIENGRDIQPQETVSFDTTEGDAYYNNFSKVITIGDGTIQTITNDTESPTDIMAINLTQTFGAGNEPTKEECDRIFANYFEGTQSVNGNVRVKNRGSAMYINAPKLRSLPNGVKDEIVGNKLIKRVSEGLTLSRKQEWFYYNNIEINNSRALFTIVDAEPNGSVYSGDYPTYPGGWGWLKEKSGMALDSSSALRIYRPKDKNGNVITTLDDFLNFLDDMNIEIYYQLAEPKIITIYPSGNLITQPSGTVYIEDVIADVATYADKITTEQPIKEIDQLSVVDYETGVEQELDVTQTVIAEDKLSFTHPELNNGDIVFFDYYLDVESTDGLATIEHYDSRYTIKDSVTDQIWNWHIGIANGEPSIKLEEL